MYFILLPLRCDPGYSGDDCTPELCPDNPCPEGYSCARRSKYLYQCIKNTCTKGSCPPGQMCYRGYRCINAEDPCQDTVCYNNGTCIYNKELDLLRCNCTEYYDWRYNCYLPIPCYSDKIPCLNNGTCTRSRKCDCQPGKTYIYISSCPYKENHH